MPYIKQPAAGAVEQLLGLVQAKATVLPNMMASTMRLVLAALAIVLIHVT